MDRATIADALERWAQEERRRAEALSHAGIHGALTAAAFAEAEAQVRERRARILSLAAEYVGCERCHAEHLLHVAEYRVSERVD